MNLLVMLGYKLLPLVFPAANQGWATVWGAGCDVEAGAVVVRQQNAPCFAHYEGCNLRSLQQGRGHINALTKAD